MIKFANTLFRKARINQDGTALIEFGLIAPVFFMLLFGVFDYTYALYARTLLQGAVDSAGRYASLERTTTASLDDMVRNSVGSINKSGTLVFSRQFYENYSNVMRPEEMVDSNNNGQCDPGEQFIDRNANNVWNADVGVAGRGGAQDVVLYSATFKYKRLFPIWSMIGQSQEQEFVATTILRNQPFSAQAVRTGVNMVCS
jgi:Flp pilus assembly protein TadG